VVSKLFPMSKEPSSIGSEANPRIRVTGLANIGWKKGGCLAVPANIRSKVRIAIEKSQFHQSFLCFRSSVAGKD